MVVCSCASRPSIQARSSSTLRFVPASSGGRSIAAARLSVSSGRRSTQRLYGLSASEHSAAISVSFCTGMRSPLISGTLPTGSFTPPAKVFDADRYCRCRRRLFGFSTIPSPYCSWYLRMKRRLNSSGQRVAGVGRRVSGCARSQASAHSAGMGRRSAESCPIASLIWYGSSQPRVVSGGASSYARPEPPSRRRTASRKARAWYAKE